MGKVTGCSYFKDERSCFTCPYPDCIGHRQSGAGEPRGKYVHGTPEEKLREYESRIPYWEDIRDHSTGKERDRAREKIHYYKKTILKIREKELT